MSSVENHYRSFLAERYSWMSGGHDTQVERSRKMLESVGVGGSDGRNAVDLGCGSGYQSLALAEMGFSVTAVDTSEALLEELRSRVEGQQIATVLGDMTDASVYASAAPFQVAVCMGDSLVHLDEVEHVRQMFGGLHGVLEEGGKLVLSFRDLSQELTGIDRAIPVRLDDTSLMATFLEYTDRHVNVHDMAFDRLHGEWKMAKSSYRKLRLSGDEIASMLTDIGFGDIQKSVERGFVLISAART